MGSLPTKSSIKSSEPYRHRRPGPSLVPPDPRSAGEHVFSAEVTAQLRRIELSTRGLVESLFSGEYQSVFKGRGLEFADAREYQPGDDVRTIDWNVTARRGRLFVKELVEERQLSALLLVDVSRSQSFGTGAKDNATIAAEIAAILALAATNSNDRAGLMLVTDKVEYFLAPDTGRRHAMRLVLDLLAYRPVGVGTRLSTALQYAERILRQRTTVFVISDFLTSEQSDPGLTHALRKLAWGHDVVPIRITDPTAHELPRIGMMAVTDPESGDRRVVNTWRRSVREEFRAKGATLRSNMDDLVRDLALDDVEIDTREDYLLPLIGFFRRRARRSR